MVAGAGDAAGVGTPKRCLSFVSRSTEFAELACVSLGTQAGLHPRGRRGEPSLGPGRREPDLVQEHWASMTRALAAGPDAQSSQTGKQALEVEGGQRGLCVLRGLLQEEPELNLSWLPGVLRAGWPGGPQSRGQTCPLQPQLHRRWGGPRGHLEGQYDWLSIAEPLVSQELLWCQEFLLSFRAQKDPTPVPLQRTL